MANDYTLILGDCLDKMSQIEDGSIDMICADLPYGTTACKWDVIIPFEPLWVHYKRVIKRNGAIVLFGSQPFTSLLVVSNLEWFRYEVIWQKAMGTGGLDANKKPLKNHDNILVFSREFPTIYNPQKFDYRNARFQIGECNPIRQSKVRSKGENIYQGTSTGSYIETGERYPLSVIYASNKNHNGFTGSIPNTLLHPTQKPVTLLAYLIRTYTNPGEMVLDNVFGSCSTGEACLREGRRFIGIEKDEGYYQIGADRLVRVAAELRGEFVPRPTKKPVEDLPMFQRVG